MLTPQGPAFSFRPAYARRYAVGSRAKRESSYREFPPRRGGGGFAIDCKIARRPRGGETARPSDAESHSNRASRRKTQEGGAFSPLNLNSREARLAATELARRTMKPHRQLPKAPVPSIASALDAWAGTTEEVRVNYLPKVPTPMTAGCPFCARLLTFIHTSSGRRTSPAA